MPSETQPKTKQTPNFLPEEDEQIAKSWSVVSMNPITANQQGKDEFFKKIAEDYNRFAPGPYRDTKSLQCRSFSFPFHSLFGLDLIFLSKCRWKNMQRAALLFNAIYNQIADNPASGSAPSDCLAEAKLGYFEEEGQQSVYKRAWTLLKEVSKFQNMASKGKAKNGQSKKGTSKAPTSTTNPIGENIGTPAPNAKATQDAKSAQRNSNTNWKRPAGIKAAKQKLDKDDFHFKRLKLTEKLHANSVKHIPKETRANNIQEQLAMINQMEADCVIMLQDLNQCPDKES
jgi:hypothetical protein